MVAPLGRRGDALQDGAPRSAGERRAGGNLAARCDAGGLERRPGRRAAPRGPASTGRDSQQLDGQRPQSGEHCRRGAPCAGRRGRQGVAGSQGVGGCARYACAGRGGQPGQPADPARTAGTPGMLGGPGLERQGGAGPPGHIGFRHHSDRSADAGGGRLRPYPRPAQPRLHAPHRRNHGERIHR
ncbi:hypothetical protein D3C85_1354580 [compost metagenome]